MIQVREIFTPKYYIVIDKGTSIDFYTQSESIQIQKQLNKILDEPRDDMCISPHNNIKCDDKCPIHTICRARSDKR